MGLFCGSGVGQAIVRHLSGICQVVTDTCQAVVTHLLGSRQEAVKTVVRKLSIRRQALDSCQTVIRQLSGNHQVVLRNL